MGTSASIYHKKMSRRVKWFSYFSVPVLVAGSVALILQMFFYRGSSNFFLFDFNSGILWKWQEEETDVIKSVKVIQNFYPENLVPENFSSNEQYLKAISSEQLEISNKVVTRTLDLLPDNIQGNTKEYAQIEIERINPKGTFIMLLPSEAIKRLESATIFNPDAQCKSSRFSIGFSLAPAFLYRTLKYMDVNKTAIRTSGNNTRITGQSEKYRNQTDKMVVNFYSGIDFYYELSPRLSVQTGFYYSNYGEQIQVAEIKQGDPNLAFAALYKNENFDGDAIYCPSEESQKSLTTVPFNNQYRFIEIPVVLNYRMKYGKFIYELQSGASVSKLDHADALIYDFDSDFYYWVPKADNKIFNKYFATGIVGVSVNQMINKRSEIFANPQIRYMFTPTFNEEYPVNQHQYGIGLRMGMKIHL